MTNENLTKGNYLYEEMESLKKDIHILNHVCGDVFVEREMSLNTLGTSQSDGFVTVPKEISKTVCSILLSECKVRLNELQKEFNEL